MTEHAPGRWSGIDITKTVAGTLAAVSAAFLGSFLGVAGTLIGAAVASIVGSVGTELYKRWLDRGTEKIKSTFVTAPAAIGTPEVAAAAEEKPSEPAVPRKMRWGRIAAFAGAFFVLAMGSLTAFEMVAQRSAADLVQDKTSSSSTLGIPLKNKSSQKDEAPTPATSTSPTAEPSEDPSGEPTTSESPAADRSAEPTDSAAPTETPTDAPTTDAPAPADEQPQDGETQQDGSTTDGQTPQQDEVGPTGQAGE
ncbi:hypothetical protein AB0J83_37150 [Actinoplanes sp. NPDC049596]|uniref:hypothetical protein n=1 Tax=unclassified Actinoplanes TaxID=2626549 RepID=UPI0034396033